MKQQQQTRVVWGAAVGVTACERCGGPGKARAEEPGWFLARRYPIGYVQIICSNDCPNDCPS